MNASEPSSWATEVAGRLRMLQTGFADDSPMARQEYLAEEIERCLKDVVDSRRGEYLDALARCFPGPEQFGTGPNQGCAGADRTGSQKNRRDPFWTKTRRRGATISDPSLNLASTCYASPLA
jgi:hypothetical protein